jgi:predicted phage terminase large subunit-like protein
MFRWEWWRDIDALPAGASIVRYWDMAGTRQKSKGHDPDYTAGVAACRTTDGRTIVTHVDRFRVEVAARDAAIVARARADLARYGYGRVTYWIESQAGISGEDATAALLRQVQAVGVTAFTERPTGSKAERARPVASAALAGNVYLYTDELDGPWRDALKAEAADFPHGNHDDQIDALSGAFAKLSTPAPTVGFSRPRI